MYAHVIAGATTYAIQYWMFYPYNGRVDVTDFPDGGAHVADWEHATVVVAWDGTEAGLAAATYRSVFGSRHGGGAWYSKDAVHWTNGSHPRLFAAYHSHAFYVRPGDFTITRYTSTLAAVDHTSDGQHWPLLGDTEESAAIAYEPIVELVAVGSTSSYSPAWLPFGGRWGDTDTYYAAVEHIQSPRGPATKAKFWANGDDFETVTHLNLGSVGADWKESRGATGVDVLETTDGLFLAVSRDADDDHNDRVMVYKFEQPDGDSTETDGTFVSYATAGSDWNPDRTAMSISLGLWDVGPVVAVGRNSGDHHNDRLIVYRLPASSGALEELAAAGSNWGKAAVATSTAFGRLANRYCVAVGRKTDDDDKLENGLMVFEYVPANGDVGASLEMLAQAGGSWSPGNYVSGVAFGTRPDSTHVVGISRAHADPEAKFPHFHVYTYDEETARLVLLASGPDNLKCSAHDIAMGAFPDNGGLVVAIATGEGKGDRVRVYLLEGEAFRQIAAIGKDWQDDCRATSVEIEEFNSELVIAVGRRETPSNFKAYKLVTVWSDTGQPSFQLSVLTEHPVSRRVNDVALFAREDDGSLVIAYAKDEGDGSRCVVLEVL